MDSDKMDEERHSLNCSYLGHSVQDGSLSLSLIVSFLLCLYLYLCACVCETSRCDVNLCLTSVFSRFSGVVYQ